MREERWKKVRSTEYLVSDKGRVRSPRGKILTPRWETRTHRKNVYLPGLPGAAVAVLVAEAFIGPRPAGYDVCHADGNAANDWVENLRWDTRRNNVRDSVRHGTHNMAKLTTMAVRVIRRLRGRLSQPQMADIFGVHPSNISRALSGEQW